MAANFAIPRGQGEGGANPGNGDRRVPEGGGYEAALAAP
jgi:hypothetical protein